MRIPTFNEAKYNINNNQETPLDVFVYDNEPSGLDEMSFRLGLEQVIDFVIEEHGTEHISGGLSDKVFDLYGKWDIEGIAFNDMPFASDIKRTLDQYEIDTKAQMMRVKNLLAQAIIDINIGLGLPAYDLNLDATMPPSESDGQN